jgi:hypothetical protein
MKRAILGIDGNSGFALLGPNLQEGESEFVTIDPTDLELHGLKTAGKAAAIKAYYRLHSRLKDEVFTYELGASLV